MMLLHQTLYPTAEITRNEILNFQNLFPSWPPTQNELLTCDESIPPYLEKLLLGIISSNTGNISHGHVSPMASFWQLYIEMFHLLLQLQKFIKSGNWELHLDSCEKLLPWFHASNHQNYAHHFSYCWATEQVLPVTHPALYEEFIQTIDQTINKDQKDPDI